MKLSGTAILQLHDATYAVAWWVVTYLLVVTLSSQLLRCQDNFGF